MRAAPLDNGDNAENAPHPVSGIARIAERALEETRYGALKRVVCSDYGGVIRLGGTVPSHYLKRIAFAAVCQVAGSRPIQNEIQVVPTTDARAVRSSSSGWFRADPQG